MFKLILNQQVFLYFFVLFPSIIAAQDQSAESDILFLKIQELEMEMADLRNEVEAQNYLIDKLIRESVEEENENSNQIDNIDTNIVDDVYRFDGINDSKSIEEIYDEAIRSLANEEYDSAKKLFSYLIDNFSDPEKLPLSLFWLGEIEFSSSNFDQSKIHYIELISSFENHWRVPLAHKKIGDIFLRSNEIENAKDKYNFVVREYPNNTASSLALQLLKNME